jgi:hypothetical protein
MIRRVIAKLPSSKIFLTLSNSRTAGHLLETSRAFARTRKPIREELSDFERLPKEIEDQSLGLYIHPHHAESGTEVTSDSEKKVDSADIATDATLRSWNWIPPRDAERTDDEVIPVIVGYDSAIVSYTVHTSYYVLVVTIPITPTTSINNLIGVEYLHTSGRH